MIALARDFTPLSLVEMPAEIMRVRSWRGNIHDVQKLIEAGVAPRPETDEYVLGLMLLFSHARMEDRDADAQFAADPGLKQALLRIFDVEGVGCGSVPRSTSTRRRPHLVEAVAPVTQRGVYSRELLIDKTLSALERGWIQFDRDGFRDFHEALAPTVEEMERPRPALRGAAREPHSTHRHLRARRGEAARKGRRARAARDAECHSTGAFVAVKSQVENALRLIDRMV